MAAWFAMLNGVWAQVEQHGSANGGERKACNARDERRDRDRAKHCDLRRSTYLPVSDEGYAASGRQ